MEKIPWLCFFSPFFMWGFAPSAILYVPKKRTLCLLAACIAISFLIYLHFTIKEGRQGGVFGYILNCIQVEYLRQKESYTSSMCFRHLLVVDDSDFVLGSWNKCILNSRMDGHSSKIFKPIVIWGTSQPKGNTMNFSSPQHLL